MLGAGDPVCRRQPAHQPDPLRTWRGVAAAALQPSDSRRRADRRAGHPEQRPARRRLRPLHHAVRDGRLRNRPQRYPPDDERGARSHPAAHDHRSVSGLPGQILHRRREPQRAAQADSEAPSADVDGVLVAAKLRYRRQRRTGRAVVQYHPGRNAGTTGARLPPGDRQTRRTVVAARSTTGSRPS